MAQPGMAKPSSDDQERLLDEATAVVKEQTFYMKRAIESDNVREALKHASNMICELRTSLLSPKNYYELYMQVFREMQNLSDFFGDQTRHKKKMVDLYESVQSAGNILPRLYLLATVAKSYVQSKEAPAKEILTDVNELSKGVQHPLRGLFLRYYISQMLKDKVPDTGSEFEGEGGNIDDAFNFIFSNFMESNRLWVRIQHQGGANKDKAKREKERHDLRALVGANLGRLSQLEGMTVDYYVNTALPKIVEHIVSVRDTMSQQYLLEIMIQVFPDEFHIKALNATLEAYTKAQPAVDMKPIMSTLMTRLANYASTPEGIDAFGGTDVFSLFRTHLQAILERSMETGTSNATTGALDISAPLEVQASFMAFTISLYPDKIHYVDIIMQSTAELVKTYCTRAGVDKLEGPAADKVVELLSSPLKSQSLGVLEMEHYPTLLDCLGYATRKQVALSLVQGVLDNDMKLQSVDVVHSLFKFIAPLISDQPDTPGNETKMPEFAAEQQQVCRLVHQIFSGDPDTDFQMLTAVRNFFGQGGQQRLVHSLPPVFFAATALIPRIQEAERQRAEAGVEGSAPAVTVKKVFQFVHKTTTALMSSAAAPETALQLWLVAAAVTDQVDKNSGQPGFFESICFEFLTQALICFEEEITESGKQYNGVFKLVGALQQLTCLEEENFDTVASKIAQHAARLLKKPMQCRAVAACSHLFWCDARRDGQKVLECMQKCLKIIDALVQSDRKQVQLWVEVLDKYIYYYEAQCDKVNLDFIQDLTNLCVEHISYAEKDPQALEEGRQAKAHFKATLKYLKDLKSSPSPEVAERFAGLNIPDA